MPPDRQSNSESDSRLSGSTSRSLITRIKKKDRDAWDRLVHLYAPLIRYWCRTQGVSDQNLPDVFQDVFLSVASSIANYRKDSQLGTFRGWLRTITHHRVVDFFRKHNQQPQAAGGSEAHQQIEQIPFPEADEEHPDYQGVKHDLFRRALNLIREDFEERTWKAFWHTTNRRSTDQRSCHRSRHASRHRSRRQVARPSTTTPRIRRSG